MVPPGGTAGQGGGSSEREVLYYQHPHNPTIRSDEPRKDEMGMDYIPIYAGDEGRDDDPDVLRISPVVVQNMGCARPKWSAVRSTGKSAPWASSR